MKNILKKSLAFLMATALIVQVFLVFPSISFSTYADTEEKINEVVSPDIQQGEENIGLDVFSGDEAVIVSADEFSEESEEDNITEYTDAVADLPESIAGFATPEDEAAVAIPEIILNEEDESETAQTRAPPEKSSELTVLAFSSDVHNKTDHVSATRLATWIDNIYMIYGQQIKVMGFCGDLADSEAGSNYWNLVQQVMDVVNERIPDKIDRVVYTTGNHEYDPGGYTYGLNETTAQYLEDHAAINADNYHIYCIGTASYKTDGWNKISVDQINALAEYLDGIQDDKPIIILNHYPLHVTSRRSIGRANQMIDVLNNYARSGKKIVYLWGHNHTDAPRVETHYDKIFKPGDSIQYASGGSTTIDFYYAAAGCMSDAEYNINNGQGSGFVEGKGLVITIDSENLLSFTYYDEYGNDQTEGGSFAEEPPVSITGIEIIPQPEIEVGKSVQLRVTLIPENTTDTNLTWSSSDTNIATVSSTGRLKGVSEGLAVITVTAGKDGAVVSNDMLVNVVPRTSPEEYFVIKIGDYALSSRASSATMTTSSRYHYEGLQAVTYDPSALAPQDILWTLEEADGVTNGYYIKSYSGDYLSAEYLSNGQGYTGILTAATSPEEVWIVNDGIDNWQGDGSTLQSTNASTDSKAMYLATTQGDNNGPFFFTVRSVTDTSIQRNSQLIEPLGIAEPIPVEDITLDPESLEIEVGRFSDITANVFPENADDKTVTWSSDNEAVATVSDSGRVKGIAEGEADIIATTNDGQKTATCHVVVVPRTSPDQYYVIRIGEYALSSHVSPLMMSNSDGYEYHGMQAVAYDTGNPAPQDILWTLEEAEGSTDGYYIKSYYGDYLSATYRSNGQGSTGILIAADSPQEIWIVNGGLDAWQGEGSTLQSTNASTSSKALYLATTLANNGGDYFFTVRSSSDSTVQRTSQLIEPEEIAEPVPVEGITLDPTSLEIGVGKTAGITANVIPVNADDKTVTWYSADETIATVSNSGLVKGIAVGETDITAVANDGQQTAVCHVTVIPNPSPGIGYVITIGNDTDGQYALSTITSGDRLVNTGSGSQLFYYTGLSGVPFDEETDLTEDILWLIEPTDGGYFIQSQDGRYLNATYLPNETGGKTGVLKLDDTPDVWTFQGSLEEWVLSGSTLHSSNADKYMTHEEGTSSEPLNLFTVRSTGESSSMIDPDNPAQVRFIETDELADNREYIIAVTASGNSVYAIDNANGSGQTITSTLDVYPAAENEAAYIIPENDSVVWRYISDDQYLVNGESYLARGESTNNVQRIFYIVANTSGNPVTYDKTSKRFLISNDSGSYSLFSESGTLFFRTSSNIYSQTRLFEKSTVYNFKYVVQFVCNGLNYYSTKYAENEIPVYEGVIPTKAETEQYTYTFKGWSSDGGETTYGLDEELPQVTGPVTYVAQFDEVPKHVVTFETNGGTEVEKQYVASGDVAVRPTPDPTKGNCFVFHNWYSDEPMTELYDFTKPVTSDITIYAKWDESAHAWGEPTWTWNDYTSATATFVCENDPTHTTVVEANITQDDAAAGFVTFTATANFNGRTYTDSNKDSLTVGNTLELLDGIIIHIKLMNLPEGRTPSDYTMTYNDMDGQTYSDVPLTSSKENVFSIAVDSPEMSQKVNFTIKYKGTKIYSNYTSVQRYCDTVIDTSNKEVSKELCYAILDYGTYAQNYFQRHTDDLANANHPNNPYAILEVPETSIEKTLDSRISEVSLSLNLRYKTEMYFYFTPTSGFSASDLSIDVQKNGKVVENDEFDYEIRNDGKLLVKVKKIGATKLSDTITVTVFINETVGAQVQVSPIGFSYAARNINGLGEVCRALYNYYLKAVQYFAYFHS